MGQNLRQEASLLITKSAHELIEAIGYESAMKLFETYGGCVLYIPKFNDKNLVERNKLIKKDKGKGMSTQGLAIKYRLSIRQVLRTI